MPQTLYVFSPKNDLAKSTVEIIRAIGTDLTVGAIRELVLNGNYNPDDRGLGVSKMLGNLVLSNLDITKDEYTTSDGQKVSFPDLSFESVLFEVHNRKNIIMTPIQGRDGTVKEYIGGGDYEITCRGAITGNNGNYPDKKAGASGDRVNTVDSLRAALESNIELSINSWYLTQFGIYKIVITEYNFYQEEGQYSTQRFTFTAYSDRDYVVNLKA